MRLMVPLCTLFLLCLGAPVSRAQMMPFNNGFDGTLNGDDMKALMAAGSSFTGRTKWQMGPAIHGLTPAQETGGLSPFRKASRRTGCSAGK